MIVGITASGTVSDGPIVSNSLLFHFDAKNTSSYTGGSTWTDLVNSSRSLTRSTTNVNKSILGGTECAYFSGLAKFENSSFFGTASQTDGANFTVEAWIYPMTDFVSGDRATIFQGINSNSVYHSLNKSNRLISNYWYGKSPEGYFETNSAISNNTWTYTATVWSTSTNTIAQFKNLTKTTASCSGSGGVKIYGVNIGAEADARNFSGGIAIVRGYSRALSDSEISQNFNAQRWRFGV